jgi:hypothetical protein
VIIPTHKLFFSSELDAREIKVKPILLKITNAHAKDNAHKFGGERV